MARKKTGKAGKKRRVEARKFRRYRQSKRKQAIKRNNSRSSLQKQTFSKSGSNFIKGVNTTRKMWSKVSTASEERGFYVIVKGSQGKSVKKQRR